MKIEAIRRARDLYLQTKYHQRYLEFRRATQPEVDLTRSCHREALHTWLRRWGCRQSEGFQGLGPPPSLAKHPVVV